ncbi:uncharacterized protein LOC143046566 [Mytilus galloprovincialis]|uniref:uncharacterized protein LOC143046566 n=1 Tax=Mytilus galloprovincialis TaxID=29158 RepID=UPI003F7C049F
MTTFPVIEHPSSRKPQEDQEEKSEMASFALMLLDTDGSTSILSTSKLYPSHKITRAAKVNIVVGKQRLLGEIIDLSVSVDKLKTVQKEWIKTHRAIAIQKEEKRRKRLKLQINGDFINVWPAEDIQAAKRPRLTTRPSSFNAAGKQKIGQLRKTVTGARPATSTTSVTNQTSFPRKFQGASGRILTIHYEGSGDYTDEVGQAKRKPFFTDHLKDDEREIVRQQVEAFSRNKSTFSTQTQPVIILEDNSLDHNDPSIDTFMRTFSLNKDMASVSTQTRTVKIAATDAELKDYTRKTASFTSQNLSKTKGDALSEEMGNNATHATSPMVVETNATRATSPMVVETNATRATSPMVVETNATHATSPMVVETNATHATSPMVVETNATHAISPMVVETNATHATSPIIVDTPLEQTEKIDAIAKVGIYTAREKEETDGIQEEYNVEQEEKNYATQTEKNNVAQEEPLVDETKCTSANVFKSKDTILGPQLTTFLVDSINSILKYVKSHDEMLRQLRQDIDGKNEVSSFNEGASKDTFQELILKDNQTFKDITLDESDLSELTPSIQSISDNDTVLSESSDLDKFLSDIKDSLTSSAKSIRKKKVLPSLPATRQWKPPQDELADVLSAVDVVLSSKDNVSTTDNSQFLSSYDVESVNRPMTPSSSSGSQQSTTSTGQLVIPSACYLAQPLTIAPVTSTSQQHVVESSCNFHQPLDTFFIQQTTSPEPCSTVQSTPAQTFTSHIVDHQHPRSTLHTNPQPTVRLPTMQHAMPTTSPPTSSSGILQGLEHQNNHQPIRNSFNHTSPLMTTQFIANHSQNNFLAANRMSAGPIVEIEKPDDIINLARITECRISTDLRWRALGSTRTDTNFAWYLAKELFPPEDMIGKNFRGTRGKLGLSPRRRRAIEHAVIDVYGQTQLPNAVAGINTGIRNMKRQKQS